MATVRYEVFLPPDLNRALRERYPHLRGATAIRAALSDFLLDKSADEDFSPRQQKTLSQIINDAMREQGIGKDDAVGDDEDNE